MAVNIVQNAFGSSTSSYGVGTTDISTSDGSTLIAWIGWNCQTSGTYIAVPAVSVSDSAGNLWQQVGITQAGPGVSSSTRCAVWMTVNAQPVSWVSVGVAGFTSSAAWVISEVTGMPQAVNVDFSVSVNSVGTALSLTGIAATPDIGLALFMSGFGTGQALAFSSPGWNPTGSTSVGGTVATGTFIAPFINSSLSAGTAVVAGTFTTSAASSFIFCGISASASPPAQYDARFPLVTVEAAFGANPGAIFSSLDYTYSSEYVPWTDISTRVLGPAAQGRITASSGRQYELQQEEAGEMTIFLDNHDGAFTPSNPGSPFYSNAINSQMAFQTTLGAWTPFDNATLALSSAVTYASAPGAVSVSSLAMTTDGVTGYPGAYENDFTPVNPNYPYSYSIWVYAPSGIGGGGLSLSLHWYSASFTSVSNQLSGGFSIPAATWTQVSITNATPPSGAVYVQPGFQINGTPAATTIYVQEAGVATGGSVISTGLVALETPIRICAWWQGRKYPVWMGYVERWPQSWPDMPQWGFSKIVATDAIAVAAATSMFSALMGDTLIDNPYAYLPCNEQYTQATVGATTQFGFLFGTSPYYAPADASGLVALNRAANNQVTGVYLDGNNKQVSTGLAMNFFGDNGTGMGSTAYSGIGTFGFAGTGMLYADPGLAAVAASTAGFTIEFWFTWDETNTAGSTAGATLLSVFTTPSSFPAPAGTTFGAALSVNVTSSSSTSELNMLFAGSSVHLSSVTPSQNPQHVVLVFTQNSANVSVYFNGAFLVTEPVGSMAVKAVVLGSARYSYDCNNSINYYGFNYSAGHLAIYPYQLPFSRIVSHFQAGSTGFSGAGAVQRFSQIFSWGLLGLKRGGYSRSSATGHAELTQIGPAYQLGGSPASDAVNSVAQAEGGQYYVAADGTVTYLERIIGYNVSSSATLGDNATAAPDILNPNPGFTSLASPSPYTVLYGTLSMATSPTYVSSQSVLLTPGTAAATQGFTAMYAPSALTVPGAVYTAFAWVYSPGGWSAAAIGFDWRDASNAFISVSQQSYTAPAASWMCITATGTAPSNAAHVQFRVGEGASPGTANTIYIGYAAYTSLSPEVPYMQETEFDYDNTYLYNEVVATQQDGPNQLTVYDVRNPASQQQYFRRSALSIQSLAVSPYDVLDFATWSVNQFSQPVIHVASIKINVSADPLTALPVVLKLAKGDIVRVVRRPVGGAVISELGIIERIQWELGARYIYVTYQISPYQPADNVLCADTTGFDQPGNTTLGW